MSNLIKILTILFATNLGTVIAAADDLPNIPANSWEQHGGGISLAVILAERVSQGEKKASLEVYIKNTSSVNKDFSNAVGESGIEVYYVDSQGAEKALRNYNEEDVLGNDLIVIKPGNVLLRALRLTADDLILIRTHPVKCKFMVSDSVTKQNYSIESSPRQLTEMQITTPNK